MLASQPRLNICSEPKATPSGEAEGQDLCLRHLFAMCHLPLIRTGITLSSHQQTLSDAQGTELMVVYLMCPIAGTRFNLLFWVLKCLSGNPDTNVPG